MRVCYLCFSTVPLAPRCGIAASVQGVTLVIDPEKTIVSVVKLANMEIVLIHVTPMVRIDGAG